MTDLEQKQRREIQELQAKNEELESTVRDLKETLEAIHSGEADPAIVSRSAMGTDRDVRVKGRAPELAGAGVAVESERQRLYAVLETMPVYVILLSEDYHVPFANKFFRERFGEAHGKRCYEYLFQRSEPCENCETYKVLKTRAPHHWEWLGPDKRNYDIHDFPFRDSDGSRLIMEVGIDITEQKKAHEELKKHRDNLETLISDRTQALRESEGRLRILYESMTEGLANYEVVYEDGKAVDYILTGVNPAFERITGLARGDAVGRRASELYGTGSPPFLDVYARVASGGGPEHFETYFPPMKQHFSVSAFSPGKGKFATVFTDITDRKRAEQALRESEEKYRIIVETANEGIWITDTDRRTAFVNQRMADMLGYPVEEMLGKTPSAFLCPGQEQVRQKTREELKTGIHTQREFRFRRKDGSDLWIISSASPVFDGEGRYLRTISMLVDITERKRAEQRIAHLASFPELNPNPVLELDPSGEVIYANLAVTKTLENLGLENNPGAFLPKGIQEMLPRILEGDILEEVRVGEKVFLETVTLTPSTGTMRIYGRDITDRKRAEQVLRETSQYLENLINYANAPIIVWDPQFRITRFNHAFERLTGMAAEDVVGKSLEILFPAETAGGSMDHIRRVMAGERWEVVEIPILHQDGEVRTVLWNSATLYEADGKTVASAIAQGQDITDRKQMMEELRDTSQYLENLINYANAPIIVWDPQFRITRFNHAFERLTGRTAEEVVGESLEILFPAETATDSMDHIRRVMVGERWEVVEIPILTKVGEIRTVLWNSATLYEADGKTVSSAIAQGQDITERKAMEEEIAQKVAELGRINAELLAEITHRKNAEEAVRKTLSTLHAALESTADAMLVVNKQGRITSYNRNFTGMWNIPDSMLHTLDTRAASEYLSVQVKDPDGFLDRMKEISDHPSRQSYDMLDLLDGRIIERYSKPQKIGNSIVGRVFSFRDITERRHAEERLMASLDEKEVLLREIHHRVKNNLQLTSSLLDMTRMRTRDTGTVSILTDVMMKIQTMAQIHTRLYESKEFDRINMDAQVREQLAAVSNIYSGKKTEITTTINFPEIYMPIDQAIPCALVINEILSNAYKHAFRGRRHGTVAISGEQEKGQIRIIIQDDGIGMPEGFDINKASSLGLKLVRNLVQQQLKGTLEIKRDRGTEVIVELPLSNLESEDVKDTGSG